MDWKDEPCSYVSAQDAGRTALVLGPFRDEATCRKWAYRTDEDGGDRHKRHLLDKALEKLDPWSHFYAIGMVKMVNGLREGKLNRALRPDGLWTGFDLECGFQAFGMMPPCVLDPGHDGDHADGFGGHYGSTDGMEMVQVAGSKELRYTAKAGKRKRCQVT